MVTQNSHETQFLDLKNFLLQLLTVINYFKIISTSNRRNLIKLLNMKIVN